MQVRLNVDAPNQPKLSCYIRRENGVDTPGEFERSGLMLPGYRMSVTSVAMRIFGIGRDLLFNDSRATKSEAFADIFANESAPVDVISECH